MCPKNSDWYGLFGGDMVGTAKSARLSSFLFGKNRLKF